MRKTISIYSVPLEIVPAVLLTLDNQIIEAVRANNFKLAEDIMWSAKQLREEMGRHTMRTLQFKIKVDSLTTHDWSHWKREDQEHITRCADMNGVTWAEGEKYDSMVFTGKPEQLFNFMYDVAYRYDLEIM